MIRLLDGQLGNRVGDFWRTKKVFRFKAYSLLDATTDSTLKNCTFYPKCIYVAFIYLRKKEQILLYQTGIGWFS
jgi:hypothetical protein